MSKIESAKPSRWAQVKHKVGSTAAARWVQRLSGGAYVIATTMSSSAAWAQGAGGVVKAGNNLLLAFQVIVLVLTAAAAIGGLGCFVVVGKNLLKKGGERGEDVEIGKQMWIALGGVVLLGLTAIGVMAVETLGFSAGDIGKTLSITRG